MPDEDIANLDDEVEVDETYIGGKKKGKRGRGAEGKSKVVGVTCLLAAGLILFHLCDSLPRYHKKCLMWTAVSFWTSGKSFCLQYQMKLWRNI